MLRDENSGPAQCNTEDYSVIVKQGHYIGEVENVIVALVCVLNLFCNITDSLKLQNSKSKHTADEMICNKKEDRHSLR